jgi:cyclic pyranopterin phosphate synthase
MGFKGTKIDTVLMRGTNEDELADLIEFGKRNGAEVRFVEYMDVGGATRWSMDKVFSRAEILEVLGRWYGRIEPVIEVSSAPADRFILPDGTVFGIIASTTAPFCKTCDRSRSDPDMKRWAQKTGNELLEITKNGAVHRFLIRKVR